MSKKDLLLEYINSEHHVATDNGMIIPNDWHNPYFVIYNTFSKKEIENFSIREVCHLFSLVESMSVHLQE